MKYIKLLLISIFFLSFFSCKTAYEKTLKYGSIEQREELAQLNYDKQKYFKAGELYKSLLSDYAGTVKLEEIFFRYAMCDYMVKDYFTAAYEFKKLTERFPRGKYTEESTYYIGMCYYKMAPIYSLDQQYTYQAIQEFQLFLDKYPNTSYKSDVNEKVDELIEILEKKAFEKAFLYYKTGYYNSAVLNFQKVFDDYPDTKRRLLLKYLKIDSYFKYAKESVEEKKVERYKLAIEEASKFLVYLNKNNHTESEYIGKTENLINKGEDELNELKYSIPQYYFKKKKYDLAITEWELLYKKAKAEDKTMLNGLLLSAYYQRALNSSYKERYTNYEAFQKKYEEVQDEGLKKKYKSRYDQSNREKQNLIKKIPEELFAMGKYEEAKDEAALYLDTAKTIDKSILKLWRKSIYNYSKIVDVSEAEDLLNELVEDEAKNGENKFASKAKKRLQKYPLILVVDPYKEGEYKKVQIRAKQLLNEQNIISEDQLEILYLWIASSYKFAKEGKKYEQTARYESTSVLIQKRGDLLKGTKYEAKMNRIKIKVDKKLKFYNHK